MADNDIRGTVTDVNGDLIQGATVVAFEQNNIENIASTTTDVNGNYVIDASHLTGDGPWHVTARWDDGSNQFNSLSKPYVNANLIPDSGIEQIGFVGGGDEVSGFSQLGFVGGGEAVTNVTAIGFN